MSISYSKGQSELLPKQSLRDKVMHPQANSKKSERLTVESRNQVSTMNNKSKRLEEAKLGTTATTANLAVTDAQAGGGKAKTSDESQEHKP